MNAMRMTVLSIAAIMVLGIWLTGFNKVHWVLYLPLRFLPLRASPEFVQVLFSGRRSDSKTRRSPASFQVGSKP